MEPRLPDSLLERLADEDRAALAKMIERYPFLSEDIITHQDYQNLRKDFEAEKAAMQEQIWELNRQVEHFARQLREARQYVARWSTWREENWDSAAGMTKAEKQLHIENDQLRTEVCALKQALEKCLKELARMRAEATAADELGRAEGEPSEELSWPWPITTPPDGEGGNSDLFFPNKYSGLRLCGYRVGKTSGMSARERRRFLDHFFRNRLPGIVRQYHGDSYGEPGSEERLRKMANVIAADCRNFKKNDRDKYAVAIADYEQDLSIRQ